MISKILLISITFFYLTTLAGGFAMADLKDKRIVMIIAKNGFRDEEYREPRDIFEKNGIKVTVASSSLETSIGMLGAKVKPDILHKEIKVDEYDAVIFVGGMGSKEYWDDPTSHNIAKGAFAKGKLICAICIAPVTLSRSGILDGVRATVYVSEKDNIKSNGAIYTGKSVEIDGNIITSDGPSSAKEFGKAIIGALK